METRRINIGQLTGNTGQIEGLPANPRTWTQTEIAREYINTAGGFEKFAEWGLY